MSGLTATELPFVSILTVNYNGRRFLPKLFETLASLNYPVERHEVLFVDNGSVDDSLAYVRASWPNIRIIEAGENLGFSAGNNLGFRHARGEFIALLNNDTAVDADWLIELVRTLQADPGLGSVTGKIVFMDDPKVIHNAGMEFYRNGLCENRGFRQLDNGQFDREMDVLGWCGASVLLRRAMLDDVGTFDESFFMYYEDIDLAWRARLRGWRCRYTPRSLVHHAHGGSAVEGSLFFLFHVERNLVFVNLKNGRLRAVFGCFFRLWYMTCWRTILVVLRREKRWAVLGTYARIWLSLLRNIPQLLRERRRIRGVARRVPDSTINNEMRPTSWVRS